MRTHHIPNIKSSLFASVFILGSMTVSDLIADTFDVPTEVSTIQSAIAMAQDGDTILVSPGTYVGQVNPMGKAIEIRSIAGPDLTVIRGDGDEVIRIISGEGPATRIEGFTVTGGSSFEGGGAFIRYSSPTFRSCRFDDNAVGYGGGLYVVDASPRLEHCTIRGNSAYHGAGIWKIESGVVELSWCLVVDNVASVWGGGIVCNGVEVDNSIFCSNTPEHLHGYMTDLGNNQFDPISCHYDCDGNGLADAWELQEGLVDDCNLNGIADACDIEQGSSLDSNDNGVPDECDCPEDVNGNGLVDIEDILTIVANWGGTSDLGDVDGDGVVGVNDILITLESWGPCSVGG
ncbi:MAG: hypothetical protein P8L37_08720 [Phycisphaerales bacterium]|nr:hypothetical protein [Phycisphaerales bacterium]